MVDIRRLAFPTQRTIRWWERERGKGSLWFVIVKGALSFGVLMYVLGSGIIYFGGWGTLPLELQAGGRPLIAFVVFLLVGVAWGFITWQLRSAHMVRTAGNRFASNMALVRRAASTRAYLTGEPPRAAQLHVRTLYGAPLVAHG